MKKNLIFGLIWVYLGRFYILQLFRVAFTLIKKGKIMLKFQNFKTLCQLKSECCSLQDIYAMTLNVQVISMSNKTENSFSFATYEEI